MLPVHYAAFMPFVYYKGLEAMAGYGNENALDEKASYCSVYAVVVWMSKQAPPI